MTELRSRTYSPERATRLPTSRYTSPEFARREARGLFGHVWQMACREEEIPNVGDYLEYVIADQSYLVVRSAPDAIRAFPNVCRHRGNLLKQGTGNASELRCAFHGWCWELDGSCREILDPEDFGDPDLANLALPDCQVGCWGGFVFLNPDPAAEPFESWIASVAADLAPYRVEDMRYVTVKQTRVPANWKVAIEAFIESYHIFGTHPQVVQASDGTYATFACEGDHGLMTVPMGRPSARIEVEDETVATPEAVESLLALAWMPKPQVERLKRLGRGEEDTGGLTLRELMQEMGKERAVLGGYDDPRFTPTQYFDQHQWHVFPTLILGMIPGEEFGFRIRPDGLDPDSCIFEVLHMRLVGGDHEPVVAEEIEYIRDPDERLRTWGPVLHQDFSNLETVQRGMHSTSMPEVYLSGYQEQLIAHFHATIDAYVQREGAAGS